MKARGFWHIFAAIALFALLLGFPGQAQAKAGDPCGPNVNQKGNIFTVRPNEVDDTSAIQCALDQATAAGPGAVVQLAQGTFKTGFITGYGFNGVFRGKGMDKTFIEALPDLSCDLKYAEGKYPTLFEFRSPKMRFSDLTLSFLDETPCVLPPEGNPYFQGNSFGIAVGFSANFNNTCDVNEKSRADVRVDSIAILGVPGEFPDPSYYGTNLAHGLSFGSSYNKDIPGCPEIGARTTGSFTVTRSRFDQIALPVFTADLKDAHILIGGSPSLGNSFTKIGNIVMRSNFNSTGVISFNRISEAFFNGVNLLVDAPSDWFIEPVDQPSNYLIDHNTIDVVAAGNGVWIEDGNMISDLPSGMRAAVTNNQINFDGFQMWGIAGWMGKDVLVARNTFSGAAGAAVWLGWYQYEGDPLITTQNWLIKGNSFNQAEFAAAHYVLSNTSANNLVIGSGQEVVIDLGTDNILKNVIQQSGQAEGSMMRAQDAEKQSLDRQKLLPLSGGRH